MRTSVKKILFIAFIINICLSWSSYADPVMGKGELGFSNITGNTTSRNLNASLKLDHVLGRWEHGLDLGAIKNTNEGQLEAESYIGDFKSDYFYNHRRYLFGAVRYEEDHFSSFEYQSSITIGFGSRIIESDRVDLDMSIGLGVQKSKENNTTTGSNSETIIRFGTDYLYQMTDNAQMTEELLIEFGQDNTKTNSTTSLYVYISDEIAVKLSLAIKHNSTATIDTVKTDTQTTVSISYTF